MKHLGLGLNKVFLTTFNDKKKSMTGHGHVTAEALFGTVKTLLMTKEMGKLENLERKGKDGEGKGKKVMFRTSMKESMIISESTDSLLDTDSSPDPRHLDVRNQKPRRNKIQKMHQDSTSKIQLVLRRRGNTQIT